jgi:ankyrin repeat protein
VLSPLHWAVDRAYADLVLTLLTDLHADVNAQDGEGSTALHYAAMCEHVPIILCLLQHKADPHIADESGDTPAEAIRSMKGVTPGILALLDASKSKSH